MKRVVVLGATGNVGAWTCWHLKNVGYDVIAVGRRKSDNGFFADLGITYISIDITQKNLFDKLPTENIYAVLHFAGAMPARMNGYDPYTYVNSIIVGTLNVLEWMRQISCNRIIFSQSIADINYLFGSSLPIEPDVERRNPTRGDHAVYSICKNAAVNLIEHYAAEYGFCRFILRFPTIYMAKGSPYYCVDGIKKWLGYRYIIDRAQKGLDIEVWGDPTLKKDIVYVKDLLQIIEGCLTAEISGGIYNVGTGVGISTEEQIDGIIEVFSPQGKKSKKVYCPNKPSSPQFILDIGKTMQELFYTPLYDYKAYLKDLKLELEINRFAKLWDFEDK